MDRRKSKPLGFIEVLLVDLHQLEKSSAKFRLELTKLLQDRVIRQCSVRHL